MKVSVKYRNLEFFSRSQLKQVQWDVLRKGRIETGLVRMYFVPEIMWSGLKTLHPEAASEKRLGSQCFTTLDRDWGVIKGDKIDVDSLMQKWVEFVHSIEVPSQAFLELFGDEPFRKGMVAEPSVEYDFCGKGGLDAASEERVKELLAGAGLQGQKDPFSYYFYEVMGKILGRGVADNEEIFVLDRILAPPVEVDPSAIAMQHRLQTFYENLRDGRIDEANKFRERNLFMRANLEGLVLTQDLSRADLALSSFVGAHFGDISMSNTIIRGTDLAYADMRRLEETKCVGLVLLSPEKDDLPRNYHLAQLPHWLLEKFRFLEEIAVKPPTAEAITALAKDIFAPDPDEE